MDKKNAEKVLNRMTGTGMFEQEVQNLVNLGYADILDVSKVFDEDEFFVEDINKYNIKDCKVYIYSDEDEEENGNCLIGAIITHMDNVLVVGYNGN